MSERRPEATFVPWYSGVAITIVGPADLARGSIQKPLEPIKNEVEPEFEVGAFVVAGVHRILDDHLPEVGVLIGGYRTEEGLPTSSGLMSRPADMLSCCRPKP